MILATIPGPVVLVRHSSGGALITNAATHAPNVKAIVYIDAFAPDKGETVVQLATQEPGSASAATRPRRSTSSRSCGPQALRPVRQAEPVPVGVCQRRAGGDGAVLAAVQRPVAASALKEPSGAPAWKTIPSWYVVGTVDREIPPAAQRVMARRAGSTTVEVGASHLPMVYRPAAVTALILEAARAAGEARGSFSAGRAGPTPQRSVGRGRWRG